MVKFFTKTVCMALIMTLCAVSLNAQTERFNPQGAMNVKQEVTSSFAEVSTMALTMPRGTSDEVYFGASAGSVMKGTVGAALPGTSVGSNSQYQQCYEYVDGVLYCVRWSSGNSIGKVSLTNGAWTNIASIACDAASLCYNPVDGLTYCFPWTGSDSENTNWGTVNLTTGAFTSKGTYAMDGEHTYYAAIDDEGVCWAVRNLSGDFGKIDLSTGAFTVTANVGHSINYIQDIAFDRETGDLYWMAQVSDVGSGSVYFKIDKATGATTQIGSMVTSTYGAFTTITSWGSGPTYCPAVTNVTATPFEGNKVIVNWTAPSGKALTGYEIYKDGAPAGTVAAGTTTWTSGVLANGTYTFSVAAIYDDGCTPVKVAAAPIEIKTCNDKASNVAVAYATDCSKATITWDAPGKSRSEVLWDNMEINIQTSGLLSQYWSGNDNWIFTADDFDATGAWTIEKITAKGFSNAPSALPTKFMIVIYENTSNKPGAELFRSDAIPVTDGADPVITLPTPFQLPGAGKYWITIGGVYDASVSTNGEISAYRWNIYYGTAEIGLEQHLFDKMGLIDNPGGAWKSATALGVAAAKSMYFKIEGTPGGAPELPKFNVYRGETIIATAIEATTFDDTTFDKTQGYTWSVAVVCPSGGTGEWVGFHKDACIDTPETCDPVTGATATIADCAKATLTWTAVEGAAKYKVTGANGTETVTTATYTEEGTFEHGVEYTWTIVTVCNDGESTGVEVKGIADCVGIHELANNVAIFPNPTTGNITITAKDFSKVEVYNTVGQLIETRTISKFDVSSYNTGIYFFKVYDNNNNSVTKRVMVTK